MPSPRHFPFTTTLAIALGAVAAPAFAQSGSPAAAAPAIEQPTIFDGDYLLIGGGPAYVPSYEGSDDYLITGNPVLRGSLGGINFELAGPTFSADVFPNPDDAAVNLMFGPTVRVNLDRTRRIKDPVVAALGEKDVAVEVGGFAGIAINGVTNPYDTLTARVDIITDVTGEHDGTLVTPSIGFSTPLSTALFSFVTVEATHASDNYMDSFFSVTHAGTLASGLPTFDAGGAGWKNYAVTAGLTYDLSGDLRNGGLGLFVGGSYARLLNDAADSPIVSLRGGRDQWFASAGVTYAF